MSVSRQEVLLVLSILLVLGVAATLARLWRARRHGLSIRLQVFVALGVLTSVVTGAFAVIVVDRFEARGALFAHRAALADARVVATLVARSMEALGTTLPAGARMLEQTRVLYGFTERAGETRVQLLDERGQLLFDSLRGAPDPALVRQPEVQAALAGQIDPIARLPMPNVVAAAVPIVVKERVVGVARIEASTFGMAELLSDIAPKVALLALLLGCAAALAGILIGRSLAAPMERLTQAAARIAAGERQAALPVPRGREVRALTSAVLSMRRELEQRHLFESLAADLSHQLKNPVAAIRAAAEVLEEAIADDPVAARRFALRINESAAKLDALVRDLLALARLEARGVVVAAEAIDLRATAERAIAEMAPQAAARQVAVELAPGAPAPVRGDESWLRRAIENLLSNAIAAAPAGSAVVVRCGESASLVALSVGDRGPGVDPAIRDRLFERFATTRQDAGGTGLGLAIVRAVAEAHGGRAELRAPGPGGTEFALLLPRA
ncbi:MAG: HAMP domain-containing protein [Deltaproteobacteria bacterium]|nr:HAMP domain-containing protein [Deltaproteobacteria bacterium]